LKKSSYLSQEQIKRKLNYHFKKFDRDSISPDPLEFPRRFTNYYDIEISAFISSIFAYGNITQIMDTLNTVHKIMGDSPYEYVLNYEFEKSRMDFNDLKHRFFTTGDIRRLFIGLRRIYENYGTLKYFFLLYHLDNLKSTLSFFSKNMIGLITNEKHITNGLRFMFPNPKKGSACKRMNLFLRWMVRNDELDFGLWPEINTKNLIIPVDTHVARLAKKLKLTKRKNVSWLMAEEITKNLKKYDANDPVKYDFALCHLGMRKLNF
jgi:uncharacterized protein (TIGR02757 family)